MDVVFAKAVSSPKHHYSRLLQKAPAEDFFEAKQAASPRLYTARGVTKGHRRTNSDVPSETPTSPPIHCTDLQDEILSNSTLEALKQQRGALEEVVRLVKSLKAQRDEARLETEKAKKDAEDLRLVAEEALLKRREAEAECEKLRALLSVAAPKTLPKERKRPNSHSTERQSPEVKNPIEGRGVKESAGRAKAGKQKALGFGLK